MKAKEKAEELIYKYKKASFNCIGCDMPYCDIPCTSLSVDESKQCALIAVDEILLLIQDLPVEEVHWDFYQLVKKEIKKYGVNE